MKKLGLTKIIVSLLTVISVLALNPIGISAEWRQDNTGWWYTEGNLWATGWKMINGKWYYFDSNGYMAKNTTIEGWQLGSDGAWLQFTQNSSTNDEKVQISNTIQSEFTSDGITLKLEKNVYELGTKDIKFYFTNNTSKIQGCSSSYAVSKFENNKWNTLTQFTDSYDKSIIVSPKHTEEGTISLNVIKGFNSFTPGKYRIVKYINSTNFILEFELK